MQWLDEVVARGAAGGTGKPGMAGRNVARAETSAPMGRARQARAIGVGQIRAAPWHGRAKDSPPSSRSRGS